MNLLKTLKRILIALLLVATVFALTACGKFTCDLCHEKKSGKKHEMNLYGLEMTICDDCYKSLKGGLNDLISGSWN